MTHFDLKTNRQGQVVWAESCQECGAPTTDKVDAVFVAECPICNLPGCNLCMPRGNKVPCNECLKLLDEKQAYG